MRTKPLSAAILCSTAVLGVSGLTAVPASAAPSGLKGDFNGDGYADLAVGMPKATVGGSTAAGYVTVVWGGPQGLGRTGSVRISQSTAGVPGTAEAGDLFGGDVATGDYNGDGYPDIAADAPGENARSGGVWFDASREEGEQPPVTSTTPAKLGLSGAVEYGAELGR